MALGQGTEPRSGLMSPSLASKIEAANSALRVDGHLDAVAEFLASDHVTHLTNEDVTGGHEAIRRELGMYRRAFGDLAVDVEILMVGEDCVAWQRTLRATRQGSFNGFPATGRPIEWRDMVVSRFGDGLIAEDWLVTDLAERLLLARQS